MAPEFTGKPMIQSISIPLFENLHGFRYLFSTRRRSPGIADPINFDHKRGDDVIVQRSYESAANHFGIGDSSLFVMKQVHGSNIMIIRDVPSSRGVRASVEVDAIVTELKGLALCVLTADCLPILLADPIRGVVAAVHAGWRGAVAGIASRTVRTMESEFGTKPENIFAALGPCIGRCCFEVGAEVVDASRKAFPIGDDFLDELPGGKGMLDLTALNRNILEAQGIDKERIAVVNMCTRCGDDLFYSYRREGPGTGRMLSAIMMDRTNPNG